MPAPIRFDEALAAAESELDRLAGKLDVPIDGRPTPCIVALAIARQAWVVFRGVRREATSDSLGIVGALLLRPIAEAAIIVRWIQETPSLRTEMYEAEDYRQRLAALEPFKKFRARRGVSGGPLASRAEQRRMKAYIDDVRDRAIAAKEPIGKDGSVMPSVEAMAMATGDTAIWESYQVIYRISSQWTHVGGWSLGPHVVEARADGSHLVIKGPYPGVAVRAMAATMMAHLIGSASRICGLGLETEARVWQNAIVTWPTPLIEGIRP